MSFGNHGVIPDPANKSFSFLILISFRNATELLNITLRITNAIPCTPIPISVANVSHKNSVNSKCGVQLLLNKPIHVMFRFDFAYVSF
jgi:hypothetical protein